MLGKVKDIMKVYKYVGQYTTNMLGKDDVMNIPFHCHPPRRGLGGVGCNNLTPRIRGCFDWPLSENIIHNFTWIKSVN